MSTTKKYRILVVDDEPDITMIIMMGLEKDGLEVDGFNDTEAARAQFKPGLYDLTFDRHQDANNEWL
jgi:DNA-binding response OmpR family regulator